MITLGFNLKKGELHYCTLSGTKQAPQYIDHSRYNFNAEQPTPSLSNFFKQTFNEIITKQQPDSLAYRLSIDINKASQFSYLAFPFGILNLIAFERGMHISEYTNRAFTKKALNFDGDKLDACDEIINNPPSDWKEPTKIAALSAWMCLK
jgi:Holliday junction resolvasome RuvABC endonuclease subunit